MSLFVRDTATRRVASEARVLMADGSRPVDKMMFRDANGLRQFYQRGIRPAANPGFMSATSNARQVSYSPSTSVAVTGGTPPYTHSWRAGLLTPTAPTSATTAFAIPRSFDGDVTVSDTVTDANGLTAIAYVTVQVAFNDGAFNA